MILGIGSWKKNLWVVIVISSFIYEICVIDMGYIPVLCRKVNCSKLKLLG